MTEIFQLSNDEILKSNLVLSYSQQREYYLDYISRHYFDHDRHIVLKKLFNDIIYDKSFLEKGFEMESLDKEDKTRLVKQMLEYQVEIPKKIYLKIFNLEGYYDFPSLICDERGIFTGGVEDFIILDYFTITTTKKGTRHFCEGLPITRYELEMFEVITGEKINQVVIDLQMGSERDFVNHSCNIYPPTIKNVASIYDTIYLSDFILKYMYNIFLQMVALGKKSEVLLDNFIVGFRNMGNFKVANLRGIAGFTKLVNTIRLFILKNALQHRVEEFKESYLSIQKDRKHLSNVNISIHYDYIDYTIEKDEKDKIHIEMQPVKPNIKIVPTHASFKDEKLFEVVEMFKWFIEVHYTDIKTAFPVYNRLENIYRVCAFVNILSHERGGMDSFSVPQEEKEPVFIEKFAHSIACTGGISVAPTLHNRVKKIEKDEYKEKVRVCRKAFDNGGLVCAFAPKLKIRDCYEKNLNDFHECLQ